MLDKILNLFGMLKKNNKKNKTKKLADITDLLEDEPRSVTCCVYSSFNHFSFISTVDWYMQDNKIIPTYGSISKTDKLPKANHCIVTGINTNKDVFIFINHTRLENYDFLKGLPLTFIQFFGRINEQDRRLYIK